MGDTPFHALASAIGQRIREGRATRSLTQEQLAAGASISRTYVANVERGSILPTIPRLVRIAAALKLPIGRLIPSRRDAEKMSAEP